MKRTAWFINPVPPLIYILPPVGVINIAISAFAAPNCLQLGDSIKWIANGNRRSVKSHSFCYLTLTLRDGDPGCGLT